jgi:hypothetical protein
MNGSGSYNNAQKIFGIIFISSTLIALTLLLTGAFIGPGITESATPSLTPTRHISGDTPTPEITVTPTPKPIFPGDFMEMGGWAVATLTSCITSLTALLGFASTTLLAWRKEQRENRTHDLERKVQEMEIERLRHELDKLKSNDNDNDDNGK